MGRKDMYGVVIEVVEELKYELKEYLSLDRGEIDALYLVKLLNGYVYQDNRQRTDAEFSREGIDPEGYRELNKRMKLYLEDVRKLIEMLETRRGGVDTSEVVEAYVRNISERKKEFEDPEEFETCMRMFLGNHAYRESVVRKRQVWLWRKVFDAFSSEHFREFDYILMMNFISEVEKCLIWNTSLVNLSDSTDTWKFYSRYSKDEARQASSRKVYLTELTEQADFLITMFSRV